MPVSVSDARSNANDQIARAAEVLGKSGHRRDVFSAICAGKTKVKSVSEIAAATGLSHKQVLNAGRNLVTNHIFAQTRKNGETAYEKDDFFARNSKKILGLSADPRKLEALPTKVRPHGTAERGINITYAKAPVRIKLITVDDLPQFARVKKQAPTLPPVKLSESATKKGFQGLLGETGTFKDWGGEKNDLWSTRLLIGRTRHAAAFAFKGPGQSGKLTPAKMGKNGDQIGRLFRSAASVFLVQYWNQIDESVIEYMTALATVQSLATGKMIYYGVIDGADTARVVAAYPSSFS